MNKEIVTERRFYDFLKRFIENIFIQEDLMRKTSAKLFFRRKTNFKIFSIFLVTKEVLW